jgi:hypothetical protein
MSYRCRHVAVIALLTIVIGTGLADDKDKKKLNWVKGVVTKSANPVAKSLTLKTVDGEHEYSLADEVLIFYPIGQETRVSLKQGAQIKLLPPAQRQAIQALLFALRDGNEVSLWVEKDKSVTGVFFDNTWDVPWGAPIVRPK